LEAELDNIQEENDLVLLAAEVEKDLRKIVEKEVGHSGPESSRKRLRGVTEYSYNLVGRVYGDPRPTTRRCKVNSTTGNIAISEQDPVVEELDEGPIVESTTAVDSGE
jgi:hypothetical protein